MIQIKLLKEYTYLYDLVPLIKQKKIIPIDEFNLLGGRGSGKTTSYFLIWAIMAFEVPDDFGFIAFRSMVRDATECFYDCLEVLDAYEIPYKMNKTRQTITINGNTARFVGVNNQRSSKGAKRAGLPRFGNVRYAFIFFEERFEFLEEDVRSVIEAVRSIGDQQVQYIIWNACNPWAKSHPYIEYCGSIQSWNIKILKETGSQVGIYKVLVDAEKQIYKTVLMHYTNWRANELLPESTIKHYLDTHNHDKARAAVVDFGLPGYESGAIYTHLMNFIGKAFYQEHEYLIAGGDYGWGRDKNSGETAFVFGGASLEEGIDIYGEYVTHNHEFVKAPDTIAREVVQFYVGQMKQYMYHNNLFVPITLKVRVDDMAHGFITLLNKTAHSLNQGNWLRFGRCKKFLIQDRIEVVLSIMAQQKLRFAPSVINLKREMELSRYAELETQKRIKLHDHSLNAFEYAIENIMHKYVKHHRLVDVKLHMKGSKIF